MPKGDGPRMLAIVLIVAIVLWAAVLTWLVLKYV